MMELQYNCTVTTSHPRWNSVIRMLVRVLEDTLNFSFHIPIWCILVSIEFWTDTVLMNNFCSGRNIMTQLHVRQYSFNSRAPIWTSRGDGRAVMCKPTEMGTGFQYSEKKKSSDIVNNLSSHHSFVTRNFLIGPQFLLRMYIVYKMEAPWIGMFNSLIVASMAISG